MPEGSHRILAARSSPGANFLKTMGLPKVVPRGTFKRQKVSVSWIYTPGHFLDALGGSKWSPRAQNDLLYLNMISWTSKLSPRALNVVRTIQKTIVTKPPPALYIAFPLAEEMAPQ